MVRRVRAFLPAMLLGAALVLRAAAGMAQSGSAAPVESPAATEARLPTLTGAARAAALTRLVDATKLDRPRQAIEYGREALAFFAHFPDSVAHVATLNELAWAHMTLGDYDSAIASAEAGRRLAERHGLRAGVARAISNLGSIAQRRGDPDEAESLFLEALAIQRTLGTGRDARRETANSLNNLGFVYSTDLAEYDQALASHLDALRLREAIGDSAAIALSLNNLGIVYDRLRQPDRALDAFTRALALRRRLGGRVRIAATLNNLGDLHLERGRLAPALASYEESLAIRETLSDRSAVATAHRSLALVYLAMGQPARARAEVRIALRIGDSTGDRGLAVRTRLTLAAVHRAAGEAVAAAAEAGRALALADAMGARELRRLAWQEIADAAETAGRPADALAAYRRFKAIHDSIYDEASARRVARLGRRYTAERREREVERLRKEEALAQLQVTRRTTQRDAVALLAAVLALVGVAAYLRRRETERLARELSVTDALTGARNRRYVEQTITSDLAECRRRHWRAAERGHIAVEGDLVAFLLDIDHFKAINDEHGHAAGDQLLVRLVAVLAAAVRDSDVVVRWGGEEFLVLGRFMNRHQAAIVAERLRQAVARTELTLENGRVLRVTCSIGYAAFPFLPGASDAVGWERVVGLADQAAYAAKRRGRDGWVGYLGEADGADVRGSRDTHATARGVQVTAADVARWLTDGRVRQVASSDIADGAVGVPADELVASAA